MPTLSSPGSVPAVGLPQGEGLTPTLKENNKRQETLAESFSLVSGKHWGENTFDVLQLKAGLN